MRGITYMDSVLISIIVPAYNVKKYICRCLNSIISQTYKNLEIIVVDDGSIDESGKICDEFARKDKRIKVIHKENGGLSDARNIGIDESSGEYLAFVDSDDYIRNDYIEVLLDAITKKDADIAICNYIKIPENKKYVKIRNKTEKLICYNSNQMLRNWHGKYKHIETVAWNKLYRAFLFKEKEIKYPVGYYNEDVQTTHLLVKNSKKIVITNQILYYYVQRKDSIMGTITRKKVDDALVSQNIRLCFFENNQYEDAYNRLLIKFLKYCILMYVINNDDKIKETVYLQFVEKKKYLKNFSFSDALNNILFYFFEKYVKPFKL